MNQIHKNPAPMSELLEEKGQLTCKQKYGNINTLVEQLKNRNHLQGNRQGFENLDVTLAEFGFLVPPLSSWEGMGRYFKL